MMRRTGGPTRIKIETSRIPDVQRRPTEPVTLKYEYTMIIGIRELAKDLYGRDAECQPITNYNNTPTPKRRSEATRAHNRFTRGNTLRNTHSLAYTYAVEIWGYQKTKYGRRLVMVFRSEEYRNRRQALRATRYSLKKMCGDGVTAMDEGSESADTHSGDAGKGERKREGSLMEEVVNDATRSDTDATKLEAEPSLRTMSSDGPAKREPALALENLVSTVSPRTSRNRRRMVSDDQSQNFEMWRDIESGED